VAGSAGLTGLLSMVFARGLWLSLTEPLIAVALATVAGVTYQYTVEGREKRKVKRLFGRYVSRDVYEQLMEDPALAKLGGQRRDMSVLFSDIRGFTTVSEAGEPEAIVGQLNDYFSRMVRIVFANRGTVDKFVGDMIMALFGAPLDDPAHADHAVATAVEMIAELHRMNEEWAAAGRPTLDIGVGINSGDMVAGNIGSETIMSYTVIGDNVNLASRLESLNKHYQSRIIISEATRERLKGQYDVRPLGSVTVKGKTKAVDIYEVRAPAPAVSAQE
jgi:adenylate cyclase